MLYSNCDLKIIDSHQDQASFLYKASHLRGSFRSVIGLPCGSHGKESVCNARDPGSVLDQEGSLEKGMATLSSILAWKIQWREEPGVPQSMGS